MKIESIEIWLAPGGIWRETEAEAREERGHHLRQESKRRRKRRAETFIYDTGVVTQTGAGAM